MFSKKDTTRKLGTWPDPVTADIAAGTLKASGIDCEVRNTFLWSAAGELPPDICAPEIWLTGARPGNSQRNCRKRRGPRLGVPELRRNH